MADERIEIEIVLDDGSIQKGFAKFEQAAKDAGQKSEGFLSKAFKIDGFADLNAAIGLLGKVAEVAGKAFQFIGASIEEASQKQEAINKLNFALAQTGQFSESASRGIVAFADSLEGASRFTDDQILENAALLQSLTRLDSQGLKQATQASADLATALGVDLSTATNIVAKAANGNTTALARYGIQAEKGKTNAETFANVLGQLSDRFGGAAANSVNTFGGKIDQLGKTFDNFKEGIGEIIINNPKVVAAIGAIADSIGILSGQIITFIKNGDLVNRTVDAFIQVGRVLTDYVIPIGEQFVNFFKVGALLVAESFVGLFSVLLTAASKVADFFGLDSVKAQVDAFQSTVDGAFKGIQDSRNEAIETVNDFPVTNAISTAFDTIATKVQNAKAVTQEFKNIIATPIPIEEIGLATAVDSFTAAFDFFPAKIAATAENTSAAVARMKKDFTSLGETTRNAFGGAIAQGFAAFGKALASGENALKAFVKAFIGAIGQAAIALGSELILRGLAYSVDPFLAGFGPGLIAAGAALATFGGVLSAVGGGGGAASAGGTAGAGGSVTTPAQQSLSTSEAPELVEKQTSVKIDVAGTVLDPISVGRQISQILNDSFSASGSKVVTA